MKTIPEIDAVQHARIVMEGLAARNAMAAAEQMLAAATAQANLAQQQRAAAHRDLAAAQDKLRALRAKHQLADTDEVVIDPGGPHPVGTVVSKAPEAPAPGGRAPGVVPINRKERRAAAKKRPK